MRERVVWVGVKHLGVGWAAKILTDWGVAISQAESPPSPSLLILGEDQKQQYESVKLSKIILRDLSMSSHHVLALSGVLVTFGQYKDLFLPQYVV